MIAPVFNPLSASPTLPAPATASAGSASLFAELLNLDTQDAALLPAQEDPTLPAAMPTTDLIHRPQQDSDTAEDTPWPPEGLASLWLPAAPPPAVMDAASIPVAAAPAIATGTGTVSFMAENPMSGQTTPPAIQQPLLHLASAQVPRSMLDDAWTQSTEDSIAAAQADRPLPASIPMPSIDLHPALGEPASSLPEQTRLFPAPDTDIAVSETLPRLANASGDTAGVANTPIPVTPTPSLPLFTSTPIHSNTLTTAPFPTPDLHADNFPDTLGPHIQWLAEHKIGHAQLQLTPQDMGPLEVRLKLDGDQLHAHFTSAEPDVRQALEHALPRLRELLGEHGLNLSEGQISQRQPQHHSTSSAHIEAPVEDELPPETPPPPTHSTHLLDTYA